MGTVKGSEIHCVLADHFGEKSISSVLRVTTGALCPKMCNVGSNRCVDEREYE